MSRVALRRTGATRIARCRTRTSTLAAARRRAPIGSSDGPPQLPSWRSAFGLPDFANVGWLARSLAGRGGPDAGRRWGSIPVLAPLGAGTLPQRRTPNRQADLARGGGVVGGIRIAETSLPSLTRG